MPLSQFLLHLMNRIYAYPTPRHVFRVTLIPFLTPLPPLFLISLFSPLFLVWYACYVLCKA